jgi:nucleotide-binding universal stress UspA family protein
MTARSDPSAPEGPAYLPTAPGPSAPSSAPSFRRVLLAVQPEEPNPRVWEIMGDLVRAGAQGLVCYAVLRSTTAAADAADGSPANEEELAIAQKLRTRAIAHLGVEARAIPIRILHGDPGERICEYAEYAQCDLIVLGTRAKPSFRTWVRGSVSRYVVNHSRRSVLLVGD